MYLFLCRIRRHRIRSAHFKVRFNLELQVVPTVSICLCFLILILLYFILAVNSLLTLLRTLILKSPGITSGYIQSFLHSRNHAYLFNLRNSLLFRMKRVSFKNIVRKPSGRRGLDKHPSRYDQ